VATNDQTVFSCNTASAPPAITDLEAVSASPSTELPHSVTGSAPPCGGQAPPGKTVAASPPPLDASSLDTVASSQDTFGSVASPADVTLSFEGSSPGSNTYSVNGGQPHPWPSAGVIYVYGDASISGEDCLPVTVGASGGIAITGNLFDNNACPGAVTGLIANDGVSIVPAVEDGQITCWSAPVEGQCMTVQAAIIALGASDLPPTGSPDGGSFSLVGWDTYASPLGSGTTCDFDSAVAADGASAFWELTDTGATPTAVSWTGAGLPDAGTIVGNATEGVTPGPLGCLQSSPAMSFSGGTGGGPGGYITTSQAYAPPSSISLAAWFNTTGDGPLLSLANGATAAGSTASDLGLWVGTDGAIRFGFAAAAGVYPSIASPAGISYADGHWHFVVATLSSNGTTLSVDGRPVAADLGVAAVPPGQGYWWIGAMEDPSMWPATDAAGSQLATFTGQIGRVAVFPYALGTSASAVLYNAGQVEPDRCAGLSVCALAFRGSYYERFRGAFGAYTPSPAGPVTETGVPKDFSLDPRLSETQPPYFLGPVSGGWLRSGATVTGALTP
jgi:hypothetical protein